MSDKDEIMNNENEPLRRSFVVRSEFPDIARLAMTIELFDEMDKDEAIRTLRYLRDRYVTNRKSAALQRALSEEPGHGA